ncbi:hypothetical protein [Bacillus mojavensis]|uniref:hypothetical protein n=1 Tax=Bacillus mojavensis TaxID=72360 RepID=UPI002DB7DD1D|nr:hypothetical protein [Bacillus mojavensis]MEC1668275.1 hypothetical protein [Bacillus mojavensis]
MSNFKSMAFGLEPYKAEGTYQLDGDILLIEFNYSSSTSPFRKKMRSKEDITSSIAFYGGEDESELFNGPFQVNQIEGNAVYLKVK